MGEGGVEFWLEEGEEEIEEVDTERVADYIGLEFEADLDVSD